LIVMLDHAGNRCGPNVLSPGFRREGKVAGNGVAPDEVEPVGGAGGDFPNLVGAGKELHRGNEAVRVSGIGAEEDVGGQGKAGASGG